MNLLKRETHLLLLPYVKIPFRNLPVAYNLQLPILKFESDVLNRTNMTYVKMLRNLVRSVGKPAEFHYMYSGDKFLLLCDAERIPYFLEKRKESEIG